jgi:hypothetical protein
MNDFERKLSQQPFRLPPPEWREAILAVPGNIVVPDIRTWRDWLWPSPKAWAALAAVWLIFLALSFSPEPPGAREIAASPQPPASPTLLAYHQSRAFVDVLESSN